MFGRVLPATPNARKRLLAYERAEFVAKVCKFEKDERPARPDQLIEDKPRAICTPRQRCAPPPMRSPCSPIRRQPPRTNLCHIRRRPRPLPPDPRRLPPGPARLSFPARFTLVAATNPCPCGWAADAVRACRCTRAAIDTYQRRLSGPLLDRIDLRVHVPRVPFERLRDDGRERSAVVRDRVLAARERMRVRLGATRRRVNADLTVPEVKRFCAVDAETESLLAEVVRGRRLSARGYHRVLRVARTSADLAESDSVRAEDVALALLLRSDP